VLATVTNSNLGGAGIAALIIAWFVVWGGSLVMLVVALVDIVRRPEWQWKLAGQEKVLWLLLVILVNILAIPSLIYWFSIRKKLVVVEQAAAAGQFGPGQMTYAGWAPVPPNPYPGTVPPGWHPDPSGQHQWRWWDGTRWTDHTWSNPPPPRAADPLVT
jgi:Protein of unknown function (DUF2510)